MDLLLGPFKERDMVVEGRKGSGRGRCVIVTLDFAARTTPARGDRIERSSREYKYYFVIIKS